MGLGSFVLRKILWSLRLSRSKTKWVKILIFTPFLVAKTNGGEISMIERLHVFRSWGWDVQVHIALPDGIQKQAQDFLQSMGTPLTDAHYEVDGIPCRVEFRPGFHPEKISAQTEMEKYFFEIAELEKPDFVWAHYTDYFAVTSAVRWKADRAWIILTDNEYPRLEEIQKYPSLGEAYKKIKTLIVASRFMRTKARESYPNARVLWIPNPVTTFLGETLSRSPQAWVFVNPTEVKGLDFMMELVKTLPKEEFLFVGNWATEMPGHLPPNVRTLPRQQNLRNVFSNAKGLLMPSVWEEAFGRLALEAMAAGVPVIASDRGALPETVGMGGDVLPLELSVWTEHLAKFSDAKQKARESRLKEYRRDTTHRYEALKRYLSVNLLQ